MDKPENPWIEWAGGKCPVERETLVQARFRGWTGEQANRADVFYAGDWHWSHRNRRTDIIAYRIVQP